jgi:hypothetical protein
MSISGNLWQPLKAGHWPFARHRLSSGRPLFVPGLNQNPLAGGFPACPLPGLMAAGRQSPAAILGRLDHSAGGRFHPARFRRCAGLWRLARPAGVSSIAGRASRLLASCWRSGAGCLMALVSATMFGRPGGVQCPGVRHRGASPATGRPGAPLASPAGVILTRRASGLPAASAGAGPGVLMALGRPRPPGRGGKSPAVSSVVRRAPILLAGLWRTGRGV